jgi:hypothetical protein
MIFLTDLSDLKALPPAAAIRNVSGCPIQPIVGGSTASRPGAGRMSSGFSSDAAATTTCFAGIHARLVGSFSQQAICVVTADE